MSQSHDVSQLRTSDDVASPATPASDESDAIVVEVGLTQRQLNALDLLIGGSTVTAAAKKIGVCRRTLTRWKSEVAPFKIELKRRRDDLAEEHDDRMRAMVTKALDVMDEHLDSRYAPTCHRAARTILQVTGLGRSIGIKPSATPTQSESAANATNASAAPTSNAATKEKPMSLSTAKALLQAVNAIDLLSGFNSTPAGASDPR
jgi:hypothetical protein